MIWYVLMDRFLITVIFFLTDTDIVYDCGLLSSVVSDQGFDFCMLISVRCNYSQVL